MRFDAQWNIDGINFVDNKWQHKRKGISSIRRNEEEKKISKEYRLTIDK